MNQWIIIPVVAAAFILVVVISACNRRRDRLRRSEQRRLELVLQPKETVKVICPQRSGRCILTNQRLIFDNRSGIHAVTLRSILHLQGYTGLGKKTMSPAQMAKLTVKARQEYTIENTGPEFLELAKPLVDRMKRKHDRQKKKAEEQKPKT